MLEQINEALSTSSASKQKQSKTLYEFVKEQSTEDYFNGNKFSIDAFNTKYALHKDETYVQALKRVCDYIASCEATDELKKYWSECWFDEIYNDWWHPAGSIMSASANPRKISLMNCTTLALEEDTLESIFKTAYEAAKCAAYRQGLGIDFSNLRPRDAKVNNSAKSSSGAIHWMEFIDNIGWKIGQKARVPAMLFSLECSSYDIEEFVTVKSDYSKIQNANISVQMTNDFYDAVINDTGWKLLFDVKDTGEHLEKTIKARDLLMLIAKNMRENAEPGIQNIDIARKHSNSDAVDFPIISTNACSEEYLDASKESAGTCCLSSINCGTFSLNAANRSKELKKIAFSINRFLDNVVEMEIRDKRHPTEKHLNSLVSLRRTGAGLTNIAGYLFKAGLSYGTLTGNKSVEEFVREYTNQLYASSVELGKEKGSFKAFDKEKIQTALNIQKRLKQRLSIDTLRNIEVSCIAPCGTLNLMFRKQPLSSGIEPPFGLYYWKRTRMTGKYEYYFIVPDAVNSYMNSINVPIDMECGSFKDDWAGTKGKEIAALINKHCKHFTFKTTRDISAFDKLDLMARVQEWIDNSISVTYLLNADATDKDVYNFILEAYNKEVKSVAAFPDKQMYGIVSFEPFKDLAKRLISENVIIDKRNFSEEEIAELNIKAVDFEKRPNDILYMNAPKRLDVLGCDIHQYKINGKNWIILVGMLNDKPYEVFGGAADDFIDIDKNIKHGKIIKRKITDKINRYDFSVGENGNEVTVKNIVKLFNNDGYNTFSRTLSLAIRHGAPIHHIVEQLQKDTSETFDSFSKVMARVLKTYIKDGTKATSNGKHCPECQSSELIYQDGCVSCNQCRWSRC